MDGLDGWEAGGVFSEIFVWVSGKVMGGGTTHIIQEMRS